MLAAAAASLRHSYIAPACAFLLLFYAADLWRGLRSPGAARWRRLADVAVAPATMLIVLLPWVLLSYRSSGTPLYPLFPGYYRSQYGQLTADNANVTRWGFLWINVCHCHPVLTVPLFFLAAVLLRWRGTRGALPSLAGASLIGFVAMVWAFPRSDELSMSRYYFAFVLATTLAVSMHVCSLKWLDWQRDPLRTAFPAFIVLVAIVVQFRGVAAQTYVDYLTLGSLLRSDGETPPMSPVTEQDYQQLQARIPAERPLLVMLDRPYWLDFARNPIDVIDVPAQVSPPPGMPLEDDEALVDYLEAHGFRYLAFVRPWWSENQFRRQGWQRLLDDPQSALWGGEAENVLKVFDRLESLMMTRHRLYDDGTLVALDLAADSRGAGGDWF
jgi:hypothetical protein